MSLSAFATIFASVFLAELGDKTQLATLVFASDARHSRLTVFLASALALITTSALGVLAGSFIGKSLSPTLLRTLAGLSFIAIGLYTLLKRD